MADAPLEAPVGSIVLCEDAIVAKATAVLGALVRGVETLPGDWDDQMFKRLLAAVPGVFVIFSGGARSNGAGQQEAAIEGRWTVLTATGHASGQEARRRGDAMEVGAYHLVGLLAAHLHGYTIPGVGTMSLLDVQNLYTGAVEGQGLAIYALTFSLPMTFDLVDGDGGKPGYFVRFDAQLDVPPHNPERHRAWLRADYDLARPDALDTVILPTN